MSDLDGGEALLQAARDLGARCIFSSAGSEWAPVWEALARQAASGAAGPRYLDLTHETLAVAMATGYTTVIGQPQIVLLHAGAGLLQGANAIHGALLTGAAMVVCSGESTGYGDAAGPDPGSQWYRNLSVVGGPQAIAAPFVKWACAAGDVAVLYGMVKRAGELAAQAPAGPVYVNTPVEVLLGLPVVEPQSAVCANFPRSHPLHAGDDLAARAADADLVVLLGCRSPWYPPSAKPGNSTVLVIDETPHRPQMAYQVLTADHYVGGAIAPTLRAIIARLRERGTDEDAVRARRESAAAAHAAAEGARREAEERALAAAGGPADPVAVAATLRELAGDDAVVVDETITHSRVIARHLMADTPGRYGYVQGGLGQGLGVALGAKLALGDRLVVLTVGDGSWLYNPVPQGLMAAAQYGLPLLVVVFNNKKYLSMRHNHTRAYPGGVAARTGNFYGVDLSAQPDAAAVASAAGAAGSTVSTTGQLAPALEKAIATVRGGQTAVVNVFLTR